MPPKGASTTLQPMRLPPLHKLRIRRPNQADANPCLSIMSSVLSMLDQTVECLQSLKGLVGLEMSIMLIGVLCSMLGIIRIQRRRLPGTGDTAESLYGHKGRMQRGLCIWMEANVNVEAEKPKAE